MTLVDDLKEGGLTDGNGQFWALNHRRADDQDDGWCFVHRFKLVPQKLEDFVAACYRFHEPDSDLVLPNLAYCLLKVSKIFSKAHRLKAILISDS